MGQISQYQVVIPGQLITAALWNGMESNIIDNGLSPAGIDAYADTDAQYQVQVDPFPSSVLSRPTSLQAEIERLRFALAGITGKTYHYEPPDKNMVQLDEFLSDSIISLNEDIDQNLSDLTDFVEGHGHTGGADGVQIVAAAIASNAVIEEKISDNAVTTNKIADNAVTTPKISDANITEEKLASEVVNKLGQNIGLVAVASGTSGTLVNFSGQGRLRGISAPVGTSVSITLTIDGIVVFNSTLASGFNTGIIWGVSGLTTAEARLDSLNIFFRSSLLVSIGSNPSNHTVYVAYEGSA